MTAHDAWRTSSRSGTNNCVQVHRGLGDVRDSKDPSGTILVLGNGFPTLIQRLRADRSPSTGA